MTTKRLVYNKQVHIMWILNISKPTKKNKKIKNKNKTAHKWAYVVKLDFYKKNRRQC